MKKKQTAIIIVCAAIIGLCGLTMAYLISQGNITNTMTVGQNKNSITETFIPPIEQTTENIFDKNVKITNTGSIPTYIRVYADFSSTSIRSVSAFGVTSTVYDDEGNIIEAVDSFYSAERSGTDTFVSYINTNTDSNWVFVPDDATGDNAVLAGYYYYKLPLQPGETTESLFTKIRTTYADENNIQAYDVDVYSESIQATDSDGNPFSDYAAAWRSFLG